MITGHIQSRLQAILLPLSVLVVLLFYALVAYFSVNIPQQDDFDSILGYLLESRDSIYSGLFDIHVNHRLVLTRLLARASLLSGDGVNLFFVIYSGAFWLLGVTLLLYRSIQIDDDRKLLLLTLCLSVFSLYHWSDMAWATAAVQNYASLLIAVACFYLFNKQTRSGLILSMMLALSAPYANSNGLLLFPLLTAWTSLLPRGGSKRIIQLLATVSGTLVSFYVYFYLLPGRPGESLFANLTGAGFVPLQLLKAYLVTCAGYLHFEVLALPVGLLINCYFLALVKLRYYRNNGVIFFTLFYLLLSLLLVALFRHDMGTRQLIASRYQIFTLLINPLMVIAFLELRFDRLLPLRQVHRVRPMLLAAFLFVYLASFYYLTNLYHQKTALQEGWSEWSSNGAQTLSYPDPGRASELLHRAREASVYIPPADHER